MRGPDRVNCDRGHGVETATNDKIIAPIYESDGKKFKMDSEFFCLNVQQRLRIT